MSDLDGPSDDELDNLLDAAIHEDNPDNQKKLMQQLANVRLAKRESKSPKSSRSDHKDSSSITGSKTKLKGSHEHLPSIREDVPGRKKGQMQGQSKGCNRSKDIGPQEVKVLAGPDGEIVVRPVSMSSVTSVENAAQVTPKSPRRSVSMGADRGIDEALKRPANMGAL